MPDPIPLVLLPGGVNPGELTYAELLPHLGPDVDALVKDHELYAQDAPPRDWTLDTEVAAIVKATRTRGWPTFHVVGYSGGGGIALALLEAQASLVRSMALIEPAWIGNTSTPEEDADYETMLSGDPTDIAGYMANFMSVPRGSFTNMPDWMRKRPQGLAAMGREFRRRDLNIEPMKSRAPPMFLAVGGDSAPVEHIRAKLLAAKLPTLRVKTYPGTRHFDPPHRKVPAEFAADLRALWRSAQ